MKPLYFLLLFFALFITGLADGLELAFTTILPGVGIVIGIPLAVCLNVTMGAGLVVALAMNGMFHPKFGPIGFVVGGIPVIDSLPIWVGLVISGILYKMSQEETGVLGTVARVATSGASLSAIANPLTALQTARTISQAAQHNPEQAPIINAGGNQRESLNLKSPRINTDIATRKTPPAANDNKPYVQKAA